MLKAGSASTRINQMISLPDALDYTEKWLEDTLRCLRDESDGSSAASSDLPTLLPLNVHNHAYIRLLKWDHASDPFPEVNNSGSVAGRAVPCTSFDSSSVAPDPPDPLFFFFFPPSLCVDGVDGPGPLPDDAAGD